MRTIHRITNICFTAKLKTGFAYYTQVCIISETLQYMNAVCSTVCRDIGGSDPERMAAPRVCEYVQQVFRNTCIKVMKLCLLLPMYVFHACYGMNYCIMLTAHLTDMYSNG